MKHLSLILCASALATTLSAQHLPDLESTHCRIDSVTMTGYNRDEINQHRYIYSYDGQDHMLGMDSYSRTEFNGEATEWLHDQKLEITNNADGLPKESETFYFDTEFNIWLASQKSTFEYDAQGNCIKTEQYSVNMDTKDYYLESTEISVYDSQNRIIEEVITYHYDDGDYGYKYEYAYCQFGIESSTSYSKNEGEWKISNRTQYIYNENGLPLLVLSSYPAEGQWYYTSCDQYIYDEQGNIESRNYYNGCDTDYTLLLNSIPYTTFYALDEKGRVIKQESSYGDGLIDMRIEMEYDEHDDLICEKSYRRGYDPFTWEPLPYLELHEMSQYYHKCLGGSSLQQLHAQPQQHGCMMLDGKMVIVSGNKCFDLQGHIVK